MKAFAYVSPSTREQAVALLARPGAAVLAGGTDLLSLMKERIESPELLVDVKRIEGLGEIRRTGRGWLLGAAVPLARLEEHQELASAFPSIAQAIVGIRSPQIKGMGTLGGELCQRPRCWYYRAGFGLLALRDGRSMVEEGDNRYHAIFAGSGPARFVHPSSLAPALVASDARVHLFGPDGERSLRARELFREPLDESEREIDLRAGEILTAVELPEPAGPNATYEVRERQALDWPLAAAAVHLGLDGRRVASARVVLGHVAPTPWVSEVAAQALLGAEIDEDRARAAGRAAVEAAAPLSHNRYKVRLAEVAVRRAVLRAAGGEV